MMNNHLDDLVALRTAELQAANDQLKKEIARLTASGNTSQQAQKMEALGQLAAGIAHDFNNILAVILGNASLLLDGKSPADKETRPLQSICASADRASKLVRQLLTLSRRQLPELRPMNLRETLMAVSESLPGSLTPAINLEISAPADIPDVRADAAMLESLVMNLASNARDAMPDGGRLKISLDTVEISADSARANPEIRPGRFVRLSVADTGCGIGPEILPRVFEPFFTTKPVGKGTGLGLATVYGIARQHDGWVEVRSKVNEGSTFRVLIPALAPAQPTRKPAPPAVSTSGGETILVVEDEPDLRDLVSQILESCGYKVLSAGTGAEALEIWGKSRADIRLLLTDMVLPDGISGRNLADRLTAENRRLRVIFTSGYSAGMPGTELADIEARQFLAKPYRPATLMEIVRRSLDEPMARTNSAPA